MRPKSAALLMLALGCGLVASIGVNQLIKHGNESTASVGETVPVFIANADVGLGDILTSQAVKLEQWDKDKVPPGAISRIEDVDGRRTRTRLYAGEPILDFKLMSKGASGQGATSLIPKGYRVVPVRIDSQSSSNLIQPGDRVDVVIHVVRDPARDIAETVTRTILQDIKVFAVNDVLDLEKEKDPNRPIAAKTISLLVTPDQGVKITLAQQMGSVQLIMRSPEDDIQTGDVQATPAELFGVAEKSTRPNETLMAQPAQPPVDKGKGFLSFLGSMHLKKRAAPPPDVKNIETWTMRILQPSEVSDVMLESDGSKGAATGAAKFWRNVGTINANKSASGSPPPTPQTGIAEPSADAPETPEPAASPEPQKEDVVAKNQKA